VRFEDAMKSNRTMNKGRHAFDGTLAAMERMELYCTAHPDSPSATRRPRLMIRGQLWIALLGPSVEEGIVGIGQSVEAALRAFDAQYFAGARQRAPKISSRDRNMFTASRLTAA
jgi:hypothetical protein